MTTLLLVLVALCSLEVVRCESSYWKRASNAFGLVGALILGNDGAQSSDTKQRQGLQLISGGFPRTGTKSIEAALSRVGFRVYDVRAMLAHGHMDAWTAAAKEWKQNKNLEPMEDMVQLIEQLGYSSTMDIPMFMLAPALIHVRPNAKVLWNYRHAGIDDWYESFTWITKAAESLMYSRPWKWVLPNTSLMMKELVRTMSPINAPKLTYPEYLERPLPWYDRLKGGNHPFETNGQLKFEWKGFYQAFPRVLQGTIRQARGVEDIDAHYLEYTVQQGWAPLLAFLEIEDETLASEPFPRMNYQGILKVVVRVMHFIALTLPLWIGLILYLIWKGLRLVSRLLVRSKAAAKAKKD